MKLTVQQLPSRCSCRQVRKFPPSVSEACETWGHHQSGQLTSLLFPFWKHPGLVPDLGEESNNLSENFRI